MREVELKLQVSPAARAAVERSVTAAGVQRTRLQALYFDTPDGRLAAAGLALRLRKEGRRWVQTLKAGSAHGLARGEHNVVLAAAPGEPPLPDIGRHRGTAPGEALAAALAAGKFEADGVAPALQIRYRTDVWRRHRRQRTRHGSVELAFDEGEIVATGPDGETRRWPVCELEIELVAGSPRAVVDTALRCAARHGLWLDTRSKSERGARLAQGRGPRDPAPAVKAGALRLRKGMSAAQAWSAVLGNVLAQALPNWSEVAAGSGDAEAVHQLRVALRRLRSAHKFFEGWPGVAPAPWAEGVAGLFRVLGVRRDREVLSGGLQREVDEALAAHGEPALPLPASAEAAEWDESERVTHGLVLIELCRVLAGEPVRAMPGGAGAAKDSRNASLRVGGVRTVVDAAAGVGTESARNGGADWAAAGIGGDGPAGVERAAADAQAEEPVGAEAAEAGSQPASAADDAALRSLAARRLQHWHAQVRRDAKRFDALDDDRRHRLRKRLKRLRYAIEFSAGLFPRRAVARYLKRLRRAQERLGEFNDVVVAAGAYRPLVAQDPRAWFALGWLSLRRDGVLAEAGRDLDRLRRAKPFWE